MKKSSRYIISAVLGAIGVMSYVFYVAVTYIDFDPDPNIGSVAFVKPEIVSGVILFGGISLLIGAILAISTLFSKSKNI
ncbi:MAG: hypothetical protein WC750_04015 [Patescibacteria group bacterium]|jgi:hypothetical protein